MDRRKGRFSDTLPFSSVQHPQRWLLRLDCLLHLHNLLPHLLMFLAIWAGPGLISIPLFSSSRLSALTNVWPLRQTGGPFESDMGFASSHVNSVADPPDDPSSLTVFAKTQVPQSRGPATNLQCSACFFSMLLLPPLHFHGYRNIPTEVAYRSKA